MEQVGGGARTGPRKELAAPAWVRPGLVSAQICSCCHITSAVEEKQYLT